MKTSGLSLSIAVLAFGASTIYLAMELSKERAHSEQLADATRALNARIAELEKTVKELQRAAEVKSQALAMLQAQAESAKGSPSKSGTAPVTSGTAPGISSPNTGSRWNRARSSAPQSAARTMARV